MCPWRCNDDGTEAVHSDLDGNYDSFLHYSGLGYDDGQPNEANDSLNYMETSDVTNNS